MNAQIDIKTPSGQSLEGFPRKFSRTPIEGDKWSTSQGNLTSIMYEAIGSWTLHKGDKITIEIL